MKLIYFNDFGNYKEIIRDDKLLFKCPFCGDWFKGLAYHTNQKYNITGKQLRQMMGLKYKYQLTTNEIKQKHQEIGSKMKNLDTLGINTRYKTNHIGHIKEKWSNQAIKELSTRLSIKGDKNEIKK